VLSSDIDRPYQMPIMDPTPQEIVARLSVEQQDIILSGPDSFREADAIPEGLFEHDVVYDPEEGDESHIWIATDLGRQVRDLIE